MAQTGINVQRIIQDFKESWYFRIWALLWFIAAIFTFTALIVLSVRSGEAGTEDDFHVWTENATEIEFPKFHFRLPGSVPDETIVEMKCLHNGLVLHNTDCVGWHGHTNPQTRCKAVLTDGIVATNQWDAPFGDAVVDCELITTGFAKGENALIAFELEDENYAFGGNHYASIWVAPNNNSWIILEKVLFNANSKEYREWQRDLVYHSSVSVKGQYRVRLIIGSFFVRHIERWDSYFGWLAVGDIGGFAYFLLLLHGFFMMGFGICFNNDSQFLKGQQN